MLCNVMYLVAQLPSPGAADARNSVKPASVHPAAACPTLLASIAAVKSSNIDGACRQGKGGGQWI